MKFSKHVKCQIALNAELQVASDISEVSCVEVFNTDGTSEIQPLSELSEPTSKMYHSIFEVHHVTKAHTLVCVMEVSPSERLVLVSPSYTGVLSDPLKMQSLHDCINFRGTEITKSGTLVSVPGIHMTYPT